ncbi:MAG: TonB-dependent receptor [Tannerellaceae bacterium]|jgi:TonB-dependent SusC/RagA subfamily outer membrane receptor|nr:TonB-dependent receptor [Tannerellaceae bacterium]
MGKQVGLVVGLLVWVGLLGAQELVQGVPEAGDKGQGEVELGELGRQWVVVQMKEASAEPGEAVTTGLGEAVTTALGIAKEKRSLGYGVSKVSWEDLVKGGSPNVGSALYGKASGVRVQSSTGGSTGSVSVSIRGLSSLVGSTQPLLVVDGVPVRNGDANTGEWTNANRIYSNGIVDLNVEEIEEVSILKGVGATSLYGSEGSNGVIMVTTKKGKSAGGIGVEFGATVTGNWVSDMPKVQTEYGPELEFKDYKGDVYLYPVLGSNDHFGPKYDGRQILYWDGSVRRYEGVSESPLRDLYRTGFTQRYHVGVSKGSEGMSGRLSYTYVDELPNQYNSNYQKHQFEGSGVLKLHEKLEVGYRGSYLYQSIKNRAYTLSKVTGSVGGQLHSLEDVNLVRKTGGSFIYANPTSAKGYYEEILGREEYETSSRLLASVTPVWTITEGLKLRGRVSTDKTAAEIEKKHSELLWRDKYDLYYGEVLLLLDRSVSRVVDVRASTGVQESRVKADRYKETLEKRSWVGTAGLSLWRTVYVDGSLRQEEVRGWLPKSTRAVYPSVSGSVVYSNYGKVRASYGVSGNIVGGGWLAGEDLRGETKYEWEFGMEQGFGGDRVWIDVSYYRNRVEDAVVPVEVLTPLSSVIPWRLENIGRLTNEGLEIGLRVRALATRGVTWDIVGNYGVNRNKVEWLGEGVEVLEHSAMQNGTQGGTQGGVKVWSKVGGQVGDIMTYAPETDKRGRPLVGEDGLYVVKYGKENLKKAGNAIPWGVGGIGTTLRIGQVYIDGLIDFQLGGAVVSEGYQYTMGSGINPGSLSYRDTDHGGISYYFPENDEGSRAVKAGTSDVSRGYTEKGEKVYHNGMILSGRKASDGKKNDIIVPSDRYYKGVYGVGTGGSVYYANSVFDNTYMKLREVSIGWDMPKRVTSGVGCSGIRVSLFGRNLCYLYKNKSGYDPESTSGTTWWSQVFTGKSTSGTTRSLGVSLRASF